MIRGNLIYILIPLAKPSLRRKEERLLCVSLAEQGANRFLFGFVLNVRY